MEINLNDYDYYLPEEYIAQKPLKERDQCKLLVLSDKIEHKKFADIVDYFQEGDVLVLNQTKVKKVRLDAEKESGAKVIIVLERKVKDNYECRIRGSNLKIGQKLTAHNLRCEIVGKDDDLFFIKFEDEDVEEKLNKIAEMPTPFYVKKHLDEQELYQTVYANDEGSFAAPTSGLHFTDDLIQQLKNKGVIIVKITLHITFGTFMTIRTETVSSEHRTHPELIEVNKEAAEIINSRKGRLIICGTTVLKTLETVADDKGKIQPYSGESTLFIYPGYKFKLKYDMMITNFHFPKSSLLLLTCAFAGKEKLLKAYEEAISKKYRFYSLGDSMMIYKN